jgi:hypothetical protein
MANILEFLRGVLTDADSQQLFRNDPEGFVSRAGFDDLTGEDVVEAIVVLRRSLLPEVAAVLADFEDETKLPPVRPAFDERELDAALRQLHHAIDLTSGAMAGDGEAPAAAAAADEAPAEPGAEPEAEAVHDEPIEIEAEPELAEAATDVEAAPEPAREREPDRARATASSGGGGGGATAPSVQAFGEALTTAAADVRTLLEEYAEEVLERMSSTVEVAERDAAAIRAEADADRDTARKVLLDAREEADRLKGEAERAWSEMEARRQELREAERQLRERLAGLDEVFRTVLREE